MPLDVSTLTEASIRAEVDQIESDLGMDIGDRDIYGPRTARLMSSTTYRSAPLIAESLRSFGYQVTDTETQKLLNLLVHAGVVICRYGVGYRWFRPWWHVNVAMVAYERVKAKETP